MLVTRLRTDNLVYSLISIRDAARIALYDSLPVYSSCAVDIVYDPSSSFGIIGHYTQARRPYSTFSTNTYLSNQVTVVDEVLSPSVVSDARSNPGHLRWYLLVSSPKYPTDLKTFTL
jgi:hypothetical protein